MHKNDKSMEELPQILKSRAVVRFQDCDPYGHLYNAKYIDYFMNAREDQLIDNYNLDIYALAKTEGIGWVVGQNKIAYLQPAMLMEKVWITTKLITHAEKTIAIEFVMFDRQERQVKALMWSQFVHYDLKSRQSKIHDAKYTELFDAVCVPVQVTSFDERVKQARSATKAS